jgi:amino acid adenylation domain-containing protein
MNCSENECGDNKLSLDGPAVSSGDSLACLIYTSGTTGTPKGACLTHRGLVNLLTHRTQNQFHAGDFAVAPLTAPVHFDGSIVQMFSPLITGGTLVIARTVSELAESPWYDRLTALTGASSLIGELVLSTGVPKSARVIGLGAEPIPGELLERITGSSNVERLVTGYGVTECSCYSTDTMIYARLLESDRDSSPAAVGKLNCVGRPIANTQIYVLDRHGQLAPIGVPGELFVAGDGLAREYWNRPELTEERFVERPVIPGRRLYRTGDRAYWGADGQLHFLGRFDHQVKLQGFRIEPGEIEAILVQHEHVQQALVLLREDLAGDRRLVAYVIPRQSAARPEASALRRFLQGRLPDYMLPSAFVVLDAFPLTSNGKVDRQKLPPPADSTRHLHRQTQITSDPLTHQLTALWRQLLKIEAVDIQDNFFALGGHSLLALRLVVQIQKTFGIQLPLSSLFQGPTIEQLVPLLKSRLDSTTASTLRTESNEGPALFCVANAFGIAPYFTTGNPTYELAAEQGDVLAHPSIESLAAAYVKKVREVQPQGPYYLTGHSTSGIVAYEMAQQLSAQGDRVACLAILDTQLHPPPVDFRARPLVYFANRLRHHAGQLARRHPSQWGNYLTRPVQTLSKLIGTTVSTESGSSQFTWWRELFRLQASYRPLPYTGQITLILPQESPREIIQQRVSEWSRLSQAELDVIMVPGDHNTMVQEPNVRVLVARLKSRLFGSEWRAPVHRDDCALAELPQSDSADSVACRSLVVYATEEPHRDGTGGGARYRWPRLSDEIRQLGALCPDAIRVRIATVGICGTDLHLLETSPAGYVRCSSPMKIPSQGRIIGHEAVGIVTAAGAGQTEFSVGDVVCLESIVTCQHCRMCRQGRFNQCERSRLIGLEQDGLFAEFADVPASLAHKATDLAKCDRDFESLACVEPAAVAFLACQNARITPGETVVVQGAGPIGFYAALMARRLFGASLVTVSEPSEFRREFARQVADVALSPEQLLRSNSRFDVVIEASGSLDGASRLIPRLDGNGRLVLLARTGQPLVVEHVDQVISRSLQVIGSRGHLGGAFGAVLDLVRRGRIDLRQPVTRVVRGFDELADALRNPHRLVMGDCKVVCSITDP